MADPTAPDFVPQEDDSSSSTPQSSPELLQVPPWELVTNSEPSSDFTAEPLPPSPHPQVPIPPLPPPAHLPAPEPLVLLPKSSPRKFKFPLTLVLATITLVCLGVATYLAILNQQLSSQVIYLEQKLRSVSATPIPTTAKLKDYINTDYQFSLSFPSQTSFEVDSLPDSTTLKLVFEKGLSDEFILEAQKLSPTSTPIPTSQTPNGQRIIGGNMWQAYTTDDSVSQSSAFTLALTKNNILYTVSIPNQSDTTDLVDQVLSTIKFSPAEPLVDTSKWLSYQDPDNRFQFQYPSDWQKEAVNGVIIKNINLTSPQDQGNLMPTVQFILTNPYGDQTIDRLKEIYTPFFSQDSFQISDLTVDDKPAVMFQGKYLKLDTPQDAYRKLIIIPTGKLQYTTIFYFAADPEQLNDPIFEQILSTIKFAP